MKFSFDSPLVDYLNTMFAFIVLNLVFLICCIPVFTIGPALAALYHVTLKEAKKEYGYIIRTYFRHFVKYFKQGFCMSLCLALPLLVVVFSIFFWYAMESVAAMAATAFLAVIAVLIYAVITYAFPLLSRYENTVKQTIKNALYMAVGHPLFTLILIAVDVVFFALLYFVDAGKIFMGIVGFSFAAMCKSAILVKVFEKYEMEEDI